MSDFLKIVATLREQMQAELTRSDVLRALIWPSGGLLLAIISAISAHAPTWVIIGLFVILCIFMVIYAGAFIYFAVHDPDALRSEKYKLHKLAIERGFFGDDKTGIVELEINATDARLSQLPSPSGPQ